MHYKLKTPEGLVYIRAKNEVCARATLRRDFNRAALSVTKVECRRAPIPWGNLALIALAYAAGVVAGVAIAKY